MKINSCLEMELHPRGMKKSFLLKIIYKFITIPTICNYFPNGPLMINLTKNFKEGIHYCGGKWNLLHCFSMDFNSNLEQ